MAKKKLKTKAAKVVKAKPKEKKATVKAKATKTTKPVVKAKPVKMKEVKKAKTVKVVKAKPKEGVKPQFKPAEAQKPAATFKPKTAGAQPVQMKPAEGEAVQMASAPQVQEVKETPKERLSVAVAYPAETSVGWGETFEETLNNILNKLERMENSYNMISDEISELRERFNEVETNIHELTTLYDVLSAQYNPFIDLTPEERRMIGSATESTEVQEEIKEETESEGVAVEGISEDTMEENLPVAEEFGEEELQAQLITPGYFGKGTYILPDIPENSISHMMAIKWTEFMLEKVGPRNIRKLLEYYRDLKWISDKVVTKILHQVMGLNTEDIEASYDTWRMSTDDHMKTLVFLEKIKGGDVGTIHAAEVQDWAEDIKGGD